MKHLLPLAALLLAGCATTQPTSVATPQSAQEALRPYYATLEAKLPKAPANPSLAADTVITRFAFGSCVNENRDMKFWDVIAAQKPQAFLLIGDNVYGDTRRDQRRGHPDTGGELQEAQHAASSSTGSAAACR